MARVHVSARSLKPPGSLNIESEGWHYPLQEGAAMTRITIFTLTFLLLPVWPTQHMSRPTNRERTPPLSSPVPIHWPHLVLPAWSISRSGIRFRKSTTFSCDVVQLQRSLSITKPWTCRACRGTRRVTTAWRRSRTLRGSETCSYLPWLA